MKGHSAPRGVGAAREPYFEVRTGMRVQRPATGLRFAGDAVTRNAIVVSLAATFATAGAVLVAESDLARAERDRLEAQARDRLAAAPDDLSADGVPVSDAVSVPAADSAESLSRALLLGGCVGALSLFLGLRQRRPLRAPLAVSEAACAAAAGESDTHALTVDERFGAPAIAWNGLVGRLVGARPVADDAIAGAAAASGTDPAASAAVPPVPTLHAAQPSFVDILWLGLATLDASGRITWLNGAAALTLGVRREAAVGQHFPEILRDQAQAADVIETILGAASGQRPVKTSVELPTAALANGGADGGVLRLSARSLPSGGAVLLVEDISQQRLAHQARDSFVAHATHELRTPLTNIRLYVDELMSTTEPPVETRGRCLEVISSESRRLERMVADMLSVSEMEAGTLKLHVDDVRVDALLQEIEKDFRAPADAKSVRMEFKLPPKVPSVMGDRDKLYMTLANLLGNAIKYTPEAGAVTVTLRVTPSDVRFEVTDTGIGISESDQERIFESFYRAKDKRIEKITGTGLGLAVARQIARLHGGDITVSSVIDRGSTFVLSIPARAPLSVAA